VDFKNSMIYGFSTLWTLVKYLAYKWGLASVPQFGKRLKDVMSRYHYTLIRRGANEPTSK